MLTDRTIPSTASKEVSRCFTPSQPARYIRARSTANYSTLNYIWTHVYTQTHAKCWWCVNKTHFIQMTAMWSITLESNLSSVIFHQKCSHRKTSQRCNSKQPERDRERDRDRKRFPLNCVTERFPLNCVTEISFELCHREISCELCHREISCELCHREISFELCHREISCELCHREISCELCHREISCELCRDLLP